jgi:meiotically up-regulated gene 157 (Mug157) protein
VRLAHGYWKATGDTAVLDAVWRAAAAAILRTFREQLFGELVLRVRAERPHILRERL